MRKQMKFQRRGTEVHLVGEAPDRIVLADMLLDTHDHKLMTVSGDDISFTLANGTWSYRIVQRDDYLLTVDAELVGRSDAPQCKKCGSTLARCETCGKPGQCGEPWCDKCAPDAGWMVNHG